MTQPFEPLRFPRGPVTPEYLRGQGLGPAFIEYMGNWKGFVHSRAA